MILELPVRPTDVQRPRVVRTVALRGRRSVVRVHRWLSLILLAWLVVIALTGAWLAVHDGVSSWFQADRYRASAGDVGPAAAAAAALADQPDATVEVVTMPRNGRGMYLVTVVVPEAGAPAPADGSEPPHRNVTYTIDPGSGAITHQADDEAGFTWWLYRGHMYLWQDQGVFAVFAPGGWCAPEPGGPEPGGLRGVVCDVIPSGDDQVAWLAIGWIVVLLSGFYLWYWPGVRRWARALRVTAGRGAFTFNLSLHKAVGLVTWVPLLVIAFTGAAFAFPNLKGWYENATPAGRDAALWTPPETAVSEPAPGRTAIDLDRLREVLVERYPDRQVESLMPASEPEGLHTAWVTRGFSPWTRQGGAGNVLVGVDQYSGEVRYDGTPEDGNVFDQLWTDWSFPLHTGDALGSPTRALWSMLALAPLVLGLSGVAMNLLRRRKRAAASQRNAAEEARTPVPA